MNDRLKRLTDNAIKFIQNAEKLALQVHFSVKKFVLLNKPIIFAACFIVEHTRTGKQIKLSQQYGN